MSQASGVSESAEENLVLDAAFSQIQSDAASGAGEPEVIEIEMVQDPQTSEDFKTPVAYTQLQKVTGDANVSEVSEPMRSEASYGDISSRSYDQLLPPDAVPSWAKPKETEALPPRVSEKWDKFGSKSRLLCAGCCITGPEQDLRWTAFAWFFITVPSVFFFAVCGKCLWNNVSPLLPIFAIVVVLTALSLMLIVQCTDPGIIPNKSHQNAVDGLDEEVTLITGVEPLLPHINVNITEEQREKGFQYCQYCCIVRPPRSYHCSKCNNCVLQFDHHCILLNNCIGKRNYSLFLAFLFSIASLGVTVFTGFTLCFLSSSEKREQFFSHGPLPIGVLVIMGLPTLMVFSGVMFLLGFHVVIICVGRTTVEYIKADMSFANSTGGPISFKRGPSLLKLRDRIRRNAHIMPPFLAGGPGFVI